MIYFIIEQGDELGKRKDSYEKEGGISFIATPQTCKKKRFCWFNICLIIKWPNSLDEESEPDTASVVEMPLPWKTDVGSPLQRHKEYLNDNVGPL